MKFGQYADPVDRLQKGINYWLSVNSVASARVCYLSLARNFGHQIAVTAGLQFARGDAVVVLDSDLQDPPELIPAMIDKWRGGYHVIHAQRTARRREGPAKKLFAYFFYRILRILTDVDIPSDTGDFCLMDRKVVDVLNALPERGRYLRGLRAWIGFRQTAVPFEREPRFAGDVKYTFRKSFGLAVNGIVSFSRVPLRLATYLGLLVACFALIMIIVVLYWRIFARQRRSLAARLLRPLSSFSRRSSCSAWESWANTSAVFTKRSKGGRFSR